MVTIDWLLGGAFVPFLLALQIFLVGIALFAGFTLAMSGDTAAVLALFALGGGLLAAGQLRLRFIGLGVSGGVGGAAHQQNGAGKERGNLQKLHNFQAYGGRGTPNPGETAGRTLISYYGWILGCPAYF